MLDCCICGRKLAQVEPDDLLVHLNGDGHYIYCDHAPRRAVVDWFDGPLTYEELDNRAGDFNHLTGPYPFNDTETSALDLARMRLDGALLAANALQEVVERGGKDTPQARYFLDQLRQLTRKALLNTTGTIDREES